MPIYEYACRECGREFEVLVRNRDEKPECPHCGTKKLDRKLSVIAAPVTNSQPACPAREMGACNMGGCCGGGGCGLGGM